MRLYRAAFFLLQVPPATRFFLFWQLRVAGFAVSFFLPENNCAQKFLVYFFEFVGEVVREIGLFFLQNL